MQARCAGLLAGLQLNAVATCRQQAHAAHTYAAGEYVSKKQLVNNYYYKGVARVLRPALFHPDVMHRRQQGRRVAICSASRWREGLEARLAAVEVTPADEAAAVQVVAARRAVNNRAVKRRREAARAEAAVARARAAVEAPGPAVADGEAGAQGEPEFDLAAVAAEVMAAAAGGAPDDAPAVTCLVCGVCVNEALGDHLSPRFILRTFRHKRSQRDGKQTRSGTAAAAAADSKTCSRQRPATRRRRLCRIGRALAASRVQHMSAAGKVER